MDLMRFAGLLNIWVILIFSQLSVWANEITPNDFKGTDTERIQKAVNAAQKTSGVVTIPAFNKNGGYMWKLDSAILLPSNITVMLNQCTIQLSDLCRDNMFRSNNVGIGIAHPQWNKNIRIIGVGRVVLKGADNPRATGDGARTLSLDPEADIKKGKRGVSYGSDAAFSDRKQTGDWRNIMILMAQVDGFTLSHVQVENSHAWAVSFERVHNAVLTNIDLYNPEEIIVNGKPKKVFNKDGIDLRQGCKNFRLDHITGFTGDDFIALSSLNVKPALEMSNGNINSTMVTRSGWYSTEDDIEQVFISNVNARSVCRTIAIRASDSAAIHHVYINNVYSAEMKGEGGKHNALLIGGRGYGALSEPGKINHIFAMNIISNGFSPVMIEAPVKDCHFMNFLYHGHQRQLVDYAMPKSDMENITENNLVKVNP